MGIVVARVHLHVKLKVAFKSTGKTLLIIVQNIREDPQVQTLLKI